MATADNPPEGTITPPTTYPNPLANNVNMQPLPDNASPTPQDAPIQFG